MEKFLPARSLLLPYPVAEWPQSFTNWELLSLAKGWRKQAMACNADKDAIRDDAYGPAADGQSTPVDPPPKQWWRFW